MTARAWLEKARREKFAIGAFNVGNLETLKAIVQAAANKKSAVIIESSPGETKWMEADNIVDLARNYSEEYKVPVLINLDHGENLESCLNAVVAGYDLIHFDGSKLALKENIGIAQKVVEAAHAKGLTVEGEMDHIAGSSEFHPGSATSEVVKKNMTDPEKAAQFVSKTGIDILAAFFGNVHGVFESGGENLQFSILEKLTTLLPNTFFSLHGGSGISDDQVQAAIGLGVVKVNVNTEIRQAFRHTLETALDQNPDEIAMYKLEQPIIDEIQKIVEHKIDVFGSLGKV